MVLFLALACSLNSASVTGSLLGSAAAALVSFQFGFTVPRDNFIEYHCSEFCSSGLCIHGKLFLTQNTLDPLSLPLHIHEMVL